MRYRYYHWSLDGFWCEVRNPKWNWTERQTRGWGLRFYEITHDPFQRAQALEYLKAYNDWIELLNEGTLLQLREWREISDPIPDAGCVRNTIHCVPVVSQRSWKLLRSLRLENEIEAEPYPLYTADEELMGTYFCLRYLIQVDCADEQRSFVERDPFPFCRWRLVLQRHLIGNHRVFLVTNFETTMEIVRSDVMEAIEQAGLNGFYFREVEVI